jgi:hypothetical protein
LFFQKAMTRWSPGSNVSRPPTVRGLAKSTARARRTPHGRKTSAMRATCFKISGESALGLALTLFTAQALMPTEASRRAYSPARVRSARTPPFSQKMERPP